MKISVVFPNVMYRDGPAGVTRLMKAIEDAGYDELDMFDHVVMGYPTETRRKPFYAPTMPIMEALTTLSYAAAVTERITLGTGVLVLTQRQITLVAKQVANLQILSGGRFRLGVGIGWQEAEYDALQENFRNRGRRLTEAVQILRECWTAEHVNFEGEFYQLDEIAFEPKPPAPIPVWMGGTKPAMLKRIAKIGDGWMAMTAPGDPPIEENLAQFRDYLAAEGRDPAAFPMQLGLSPGALDREKRVRFYAEPELVRDRLVEIREMGFTHTSIDCVPIFQQGYRSVEAMSDYLYQLHEMLAPEL